MSAKLVLGEKLVPWQDPRHPDYHWHGCMEILRNSERGPSPMKLAQPRALPPKYRFRLETLMRRGFDAGSALASRRDLEERGLAHWLARYDEPELIALAARHGCVDPIDPQASRVFHPAAEAAMLGSAAGLAVFLDREPNLVFEPVMGPRRAEPFGLLWAASLQRNVDAAKLLLSRGASPDGIEGGRPPLLAMAYSRPDCQATIELAKILIDFGASPQLALESSQGPRSTGPQLMYPSSLAATAALAHWERASLNVQARSLPQSPRQTL